MNSFFRARDGLRRADIDVKYVSLDIETSSLDPSPGNILGVAMVFEDTDNLAPLRSLPRFVCLVDHGTFVGQPYALWLNSWILKEIDNSRAGKPSKYPVYSGEGYEHQAGKGMYKEHWTRYANVWLDGFFNRNEKIVLAGKNVGSFDLQFLPKSLACRFSNRVLDPAMLYIDWRQPKPPSLSEIKQRLGLGDTVSHDMYEDALDVISCLRQSYGNQGK